VVFVFDGREVAEGRMASGLTSLLILIHVQVPSLAPVHRIEATPLLMQRGRGRERRRGRERLGKGRTGTKTHDCGYRLDQSDRSIGSALLQHARAFPYRVLLASFPNRPRPRRRSRPRPFGVPFCAHRLDLYYLHRCAGTRSRHATHARGRRGITSLPAPATFLSVL
jgi:hypothetical protein